FSPKIRYFFIVFSLSYKILNKRTHKAPMWYLKKSEPFGRLLLLKRLRIFFVIAQLFSLIKLQKKKTYYLLAFVELVECRFLVWVIPVR
ncbi:hypothetical protein MY724_10100, partial [Haemophilus influenzae]|nr:hypothetical protein [Haemophilus influenzae]